MALCCTNLAHLNLKGVHYSQDSDERPNRFMETISKFTSLTSLSVCNCVLGSAAYNKGSKRVFDECLLKRNKRVCHRKSLHGPQSSDKPVASSAGTAAVNDLQTPCDELSSVGPFDSLTQISSKITEFELIRSSSPGINFVKSYFELRTW